MPEDKKRAQQKYKTMEGNYLTAGDLALIENRMGYGYGDGSWEVHNEGNEKSP